MKLPVLEQRPVPRELLIKRLKSNIKSAPTEGLATIGKPDWLKIRPPTNNYHDLKTKIRSLGLVTVCAESHCPNISECWSGGTATFMVLGDTCTRACKFCMVKARGQPGPVDSEEPDKLVAAIGHMDLDYVVLTSVDRDDLPDGGASHFADCIQKLKTAYPKLLVEVLIGDFQGDIESLKTVANAKPDVIAHNIETIRRLTPTVRDRRATYDQSLKLLSRVKQIYPHIKTKSSIMVGLGETDQEVHKVLSDLRAIDCDVVTLGQYLRPSSWHLPVERYVSPELFEQYENAARKMGFLYCAAGPFVRSSYRAAELFMRGMLRQEEVNT